MNDAMKGIIQMSKPPWVISLEEKYNLPIEKIPGNIYVIHYEPAQFVDSVSIDYAGPREIAKVNNKGFISFTPITHYVGWTQQKNPRNRIRRHGLDNAEIVYLETGTMEDEQKEKMFGQCPKCNDYYIHSLYLKK